jgi:hypothetical protein
MYIESLADNSGSRGARLERDDACVVNQLVADRDEPRGLCTMRMFALYYGREHRIRKPPPVHDAADAETVVLVRIARLAALQAAASLHGSGAACAARAADARRPVRR